MARPLLTALCIGLLAWYIAYGGTQNDQLQGIDYSPRMSFVGNIALPSGVQGVVMCEKGSAFAVAIFPNVAVALNGYTSTMTRRTGAYVSVRGEKRVILTPDLPILLEHGLARQWDDAPTVNAPLDTGLSMALRHCKI